MGRVKALTENAPMAREMRAALGNMIIEKVVRKNR